MHNIRALKLLILLPLVLSLGSPGAFAKPTAPGGAIATVGDLMPAARHASLDRTIAELLSQHHYRQSSLDNRLSALILTTYLDDLDFSRSYFLASDIAGFERYRDTLDDALKKGDLHPAYDIFNVYLRRL
ncbi:MAG: tail-specific protease, partial [Candidatus Competibacteraceae bacterium]|nr:tail-specific protease [Candidatus Competibacteraceae bacterium]